MSGAWIAGSVRARLLVAERRLGVEGARELADSASLRDALVALGRTPYRRDIRLELGLAGAQRAVARKTLLDLRLLAGWLPSDGIGLLRALAAWYELANLEDRIAYLAGARVSESRSSSAASRSPGRAQPRRSASGSFGGQSQPRRGAIPAGRLRPSLAWG